MLSAKRQPTGGGAPIDPAGAEALRQRIEQQQHWRLAQAVVDGRQPGTDPDALWLEEFRGEARFYTTGSDRFVKRLVDGAWRVEYQARGGRPAA